jgi:Arc/MetJ-type ribon-helix-helix transcriptional regulator
MSHAKVITISTRLDLDAQRHLSALERAGFSRSDAVREGLRLAAVELRRPKAIRQEAHMVAADQADRAEMMAIAAFMESMRNEG